MGHNLISVLPQRVFYMLNRLKYLDLSGNPLDGLPIDVFKDVPVSIQYKFFLIFSFPFDLICFRIQKNRNSKRKE